MFKPISAFSGFSVMSLDDAGKFYQDVLGLKISQDMGLNLLLPDGGKVFIYQKDNHHPATYTVLNFVVTNIDEAVDELTSKGVNFERYEGMHQDEKGIARPPKPEYGPAIAWFKDPDGNILSVIEKQ